MGQRGASFLRRVAVSFWDGLTCTSPACSLGILAFALGELILAALLVTPRRLTTLDAGYLRENRKDDRANATIGALRLRLGATEPTVVYLGASNARMAVD